MMIKSLCRQQQEGVNKSKRARRNPFFSWGDDDINGASGCEDDNII
jgi:hypothetical protein